MRELASWAAALCPDGLSIAVDRRDFVEAVMAKRGVCGEHGRVMPTWQGLCPHCAGYVLIGEGKCAA